MKYRYKENKMRILSISNINYKGIKVTKDFSTPNSQSPIYEAERAYDVLNNNFEQLNNLANSIKVVTKTDQEREINKKYAEKTEKEYAEIYKGSTRNFTPIKDSKYKKASERLSKEKHEALNRVKADGSVDLKHTTLETMEKDFNENKRKVLDSDKQIQQRALKTGALKRNDKVVYGKTLEYEGFENIAGYEKEKTILDDVFVSKVQREKAGENVKVPGSVLFFGPYNNGKTHITKNVAMEADCRFVKLKPLRNAALMPKLMNEAQISKEHFAETKERTVIFIDEIDRLINTKSGEIKEFEEFIKTCSDDYHCTIFAATNSPSKMGVDFSDPDVFPVRMSIEAPNDENMRAVLKHYLNNLSQSEIDYDKIKDELRKREGQQKAKYTNAQISYFPDEIVERYGVDVLAPQQILEYFADPDEVEAPRLDEVSVKKFEDEYRKIMM